MHWKWTWKHGLLKKKKKKEKKKDYLLHHHTCTINTVKYIPSSIFIPWKTINNDLNPQRADTSITTRGSSKPASIIK